MAASTTRSFVTPNSFCKTFRGAEAPNVASISFSRISCRLVFSPNGLDVRLDSYLHMPSFVPQPDHRSGQVMFVAHGTQARRAQHEKLAVDRWFKPEPPGGQHAHKVPARKDKDVPRHSAHPLHDSVSTLADLLRRFPSGSAVSEQFPVRTLSKNLSRTAPLILTVVPLDQVWIDFSYGPEAGQLACTGRSLQWTGKDLRKLQSFQALSKPASGALTGSISGKSVSPVCWREIVQAVSPCRAR